MITFENLSWRNIRICHFNFIKPLKTDTVFSQYYDHDFFFNKLDISHCNYCINFSFQGKQHINLFES